MVLEKGVHRRVRTNRHGGGAFSRGGLYTILKNRLYVGELVHKGRIYHGEHTAIIAPDLFDKVQQQLAIARVERQHGSTADSPSPLAGLPWDGLGRRLSPSYAAQRGRPYRYYVSNIHDAARDEPCWRISAPDIEQLVAARLIDAIGDAVTAQIDKGQLSGDAIATLKASAAAATDQIQGLPHAQRRVFLQLIARVDLCEQRMTIMTDLSAIDADLAPAAIAIPIGFARTGRQIKLVLPPANNDDRAPSPSLLKLVAQAFAARRELDVGGSFEEVAARLGYGREYLADMLRTSFLSPKIIGAIIEGRQPIALSRTQLVTTNRIPLLWTEQEAMFGIG